MERYKYSCVSVVVVAVLAVSSLVAAEKMTLEQHMQAVTEGIVQTDVSKDLIEKRTAVFESLDIIGQKYQAVMAGVGFDPSGQRLANLGAYLYYHESKPTYYCLVIDNLSERSLTMEYDQDVYVFKSTSQGSFPPKVLRESYRNGILSAQGATYVDLGLEKPSTERLTSLLVRINNGETILYLTKIEKQY